MHSFTLVISAFKYFNEPGSVAWTIVFMCTSEKKKTIRRAKIWYNFFFITVEALGQINSKKYNLIKTLSLILC